MKIYRITHGTKGPWTQIFRIMKLTVILLFVSLMAMSASSYSQNTKLNLSAKNSSLIDIFRQIEDQSEFYFYFKKEDVKYNKLLTPSSVFFERYRRDPIAGYPNTRPFQILFLCFFILVLFLNGFPI